MQWCRAGGPPRGVPAGGGGSHCAAGRALAGRGLRARRLQHRQFQHPGGDHRLRVRASFPSACSFPVRTTARCLGGHCSTSFPWYVACGVNCAGCGAWCKPSCRRLALVLCTHAVSEPAECLSRGCGCNQHSCLMLRSVGFLLRRHFPCGTARVDKHRVQQTRVSPLAACDRSPYGFLERFDPNFTPNTTDLDGRRYTYRAQPAIGHWNCAQFANALIAGGVLPVVRHSFLRIRTICSVGREFSGTAGLYGCAVSLGKER